MQKANSHNKSAAFTQIVRSRFPHRGPSTLNLKALREAFGCSKPESQAPGVVKQVCREPSGRHLHSQRGSRLPRRTLWRCSVVQTASSDIGVGIPLIVPGMSMLQPTPDPMLIGGLRSPNAVAESPQVRGVTAGLLGIRWGARGFNMAF